ncbi:MAG: hypothetical protein EAS52_14500 [Parapedobacter sp.]|nr:MAG: hypothetical protein EAS52_14500 [Parapedobacter sp.]
MDNLHNFNDRLKLTLLNYLKESDGLSLFQRYEYNRLSRLYPHNYEHRKELDEELKKRNYIVEDTDRKPSTQDGEGNIIPGKSTYSRWVISNIGVNALKRKVIISETLLRRKQWWITWPPIIISLIALIVSIIALSKSS